MMVINIVNIVNGTPCFPNLQHCIAIQYNLTIILNIRSLEAF